MNHAQKLGIQYGRSSVAIGQILMHSPDQTIPPINLKLGIYTYQVISQVLTFLLFWNFEQHLINIQIYANHWYFAPHSLICVMLILEERGIVSKN